MPTDELRGNRVQDGMEESRAHLASHLVTYLHIRMYG